MAAKIDASGVRNVVVSGVYSIANPAQEELAAGVISRRVPGASVSLSHAFGNMGLLERESIAILNESLKPMSLVRISCDFISMPVVI